MKLGIDFGTCYSSAALFIDGKLSPVREPSRPSEYCFPSSVCVTKKGEILISQAAENKRLPNPQGYKNEFKRDLETETPYLLGEKSLYPEDLVTIMLAGLKKEAEKIVNSPLNSVVLTIPATYLIPKKQLMETAAIKAGFTEVILLAEPVAAAIYYAEKGSLGHQLNDGDIVLVYDLGGGTFDTALIQKKGRSYELLSQPEGDKECGGIDFDRLIGQDLKRKLDGDPALELLSSKRTNNEALRAKLSFQDWCRNFKHQLSMEEEYEDLSPVGSDSYSLSREQFEDMISQYIDSSCDLCQKLVDKAGIKWEEINRILLVGGSCRIPYIKKRLEHQFERLVVAIDDPELAICFGAAIYGANLTKAQEMEQRQKEQEELKRQRREQEKITAERKQKEQEELKSQHSIRKEQEELERQRREKERIDDEWKQQVQGELESQRQEIARLEAERKRKEQEELERQRRERERIEAERIQLEQQHLPKPSSSRLSDADIRLWLGWIVANSLGLCSLTLIRSITDFLTGGRSFLDPLLHITFTILITSMIGGIVWLALQRMVEKSGIGVFILTFFFSLGGVTIGWFGYEWTINLLPKLDDYWSAFPNLMNYFGVIITTSIWGALQWTILWRAKIRIIWWKWILTIVLCCLFSTMLSAIISNSDVLGTAACAIVISTPTIGISQWLLLRHHFFKSGWWILANFIGLPIVLFAFSLALGSGYFIGALLVLIPFSAITGSLLLWLIRYQKKII